MSDTSEHEVGTGEFDAFVAGLDFPVFVVTTGDGARRAGCLVGFTTQVSIDPPLFLVCLSVQNHTCAVAREATALAVHLLDRGQHDVAELFGATTGDDVDKFERCAWSPGPEDVPLLDDCPRRFVGRIVARHRFGDHVAFLLDPRLVQAERRDKALTFRQVTDLTPGHPA